MPLDRKVTRDEGEQLVQDLHEMSYLFRDCPMSKEQLREYVKDLTHYYGFTYSFAQLRESIAVARQKHPTAGTLPTVDFLMKKYNPRA